MKIRYGFVSNSSSSSFVVAGIQLSPAEMNNLEKITGFNKQVAKDIMWDDIDGADYGLPGNVTFFTDEYYYYIGVDVEPRTFEQCCGESVLVSKDEANYLEGIGEILTKKPDVHSFEIMN